MKTYDIAKLQIVRADEDILTTSLGIGETTVTDENAIQGPGRYDIWE